MIDVIVINKPNKDLSKTLASISIQSMIDRINVIIIDQDYDNYTNTIIDRFSTILNINHVLFKSTNINECRNHGLKMSKGEYIIFVNSGDLLYDAFTIKNLFSNIILYDVAFGKIINEKSNLEFDINLYANGKLYKRDFLINNNIIFDEESNNKSDLSFNLLINKNQARIKKIEEYVYIDK